MMIKSNRAAWLALSSVLLLLMLGMLANVAHAQQYINAPGMGSNSAWTVYAFGNAQAVSDTFRALANFTNSGTFRGVVSMLAVIGVLAVGISSGFSAAIARQFISYAVFVFLVVYLLFGVGNKGPISVRVEVIDVVDSTWKSPVTVPAIIGIPASLISMAGHEITRQVEASFPLPTEMKISNGAPFNLAASMLSDASRAKIQDPNLANSLAYYVQDCFTMAVARGEKDARILLDSTNFLEDLRTNLNGVYINTTLGDPVGQPKLVNCVEGYNLILAAFNKEGSGASAFLSEASAWHSTPALSVVNAAADQVASWATNGSVTSGGNLVKQAAVLSAFRGAFSQAAATTGNSDFLTGLAITQAIETQKNSWVVGAEVFNKMMGYIFAILQVFVYALTPLILAAALIPSLGMSLLKNFAQVLIWLAIWQPMLAIVNFIVLSMQQASLGGALSAGLTSGFTMTNQAIVSEKTANLSAAATFVGTMVPVLAWAFVKGSVDFSRMIGSAVGENFSQQAGTTLTTGNYSLNQASMDSFTANKTSIGAVADFGNGYSVQGTEGMVAKHTADAGNALIGGVPVNVTAAAGRGLGEQGAITSGTQSANVGGQTTTQVDNAGIMRTAATGVGTQHSEAAQGSTAVGASASPGIFFGGPGGDQTRTGQPGPNAFAPSTASAPGAVTPAADHKDPMGWLAQGVGYLVDVAKEGIKGVNAQGQAFSSEGDSRVENHNLGLQGTRGTSVSDTRLASRTDQTVDGANKGRMVNRSDQVTATAVGSLDDRAALMSAMLLRGSSSADPGRGLNIVGRLSGSRAVSDESDETYQRFFGGKGSEPAAAVVQMHTPNLHANRMAERDAEVDGRMAEGERRTRRSQGGVNANPILNALKDLEQRTDENIAEGTMRARQGALERAASGFEARGHDGVAEGLRWFSGGVSMVFGNKEHRAAPNMDLGLEPGGRFGKSAQAQPGQNDASGSANGQPVTGARNSPVQSAEGADQAIAARGEGARGEGKGTDGRPESTLTAAAQRPLEDHKQADAPERRGEGSGEGMATVAMTIPLTPVQASPQPQASDSSAATPTAAPAPMETPQLDNLQAAPHLGEELRTALPGENARQGDTHTAMRLEEAERRNRELTEGMETINYTAREIKPASDEDKAKLDLITYESEQGIKR